MHLTKECVQLTNHLAPYHTNMFLTCLESLFNLGLKPLNEIRTEIHDRLLASPVVMFCLKPPSNGVPSLGAVLLLFSAVTTDQRLNFGICHTGEVMNVFV